MMMMMMIVKITEGARFELETTRHVHLATSLQSVGAFLSSGTVAWVAVLNFVFSFPDARASASFRW
jgi:hypothetical protein